MGNVCHLFQISCQGDETPRLCGEALPELLAFNCSVVQLEFVTDFALHLAGFRLRYNIFYLPSTGNVCVFFFSVLRMVRMEPVNVQMLVTATVCR